MSTETYFLMKIVLLGDGAVGKTALRARYMGHGFDFANYIVTIGADFAIREQRIKIFPSQPPTLVKFQIWDIAGQARFSELRKLYYRGALGALLVFDVTRHLTIESLQDWSQEYFHHNGRGPLPIILIGNKIDLRDQVSDSISYSEGKTLANDLRKMLEEEGKPVFVSYIETSAKTGENVNDAFQQLGESVLGHIKDKMA